MNLDDFERILRAFADHPSDVVIDKGRLLVQIRDELIEASLSNQDGAIWVEESRNNRYSAYTWVLRRLAKVDLLADRILSHTPEEKHFVTPRGFLLDRIDKDPNERGAEKPDAATALIDLLSRNSVGTSTVLYLTSDAGEGKTTVVNHVARKQAERFKTGQATWLLLPINLGGRPFLRFDDIVVGELVNRLRFQHLYYDAFLELVNLEVIVPAFDGFEEMFIESPTGEAVSALGNLVQHLRSSGSVLIAARKAYFEFHSFRTQARLFDAISQSVSFSRLALRRWQRNQFKKYCNLRGLPNGDILYRKVAERWNEKHPLLTRAVLVEKLVDVVKELSSVDEVLGRISTDPDEHLADFVTTIIEREAEKKWLDRSGEAAKPLLTVEGHFDLLAMIAQEMWEMRSNALKLDHLDLVAQMFVEDFMLSPDISSQIRRRLPDHSLLVPVPRTNNMLAFDHDDFRWFFLGRALGQLLLGGSDEMLASWLDIAAIPANTVDAACRYVEQQCETVEEVVERVAGIGRQVLSTSFAKENGGNVALALAARGKKAVTLEGLVFPPEALTGIRLERMRVHDCEFQATSLKNARIIDCEFRQCRFHHLESGAETVSGSTLKDCEVNQWVDIADNQQVDTADVIYDPLGIRQALEREGFRVERSEESEETVQPGNGTVVQAETEMAERALRIFMRATHINGYTFRKKLGHQAKEFSKDVLPKLVKGRILKEVPYLGSGKDTRYKLNVSMQRIAEVVPTRGLTLAQLIDKLGGESES